MIRLTRLDRSEIFVNPHQIEFAESTPDTVLSMLSGRKIVVRESVPEIVEAIVRYRRSIGSSFAGNED